jgi:hypothetical protein
MELIFEMNYSFAELLNINSSKLIKESFLRRLETSELNQQKINLVFNAILKNPELAPKLRNSNNIDTYLLKWLRKYTIAFNKRPSISIGNPPSTIQDKAIDQLIKARLPDLSDKEIEKIKFGHRLSMTAENLIGCFLEEYIANILEKDNWACAWGSTVKSTDFVSHNFLLQIKNKFNSENSSSSSVRDGTKINKWYRLKSNGTTNWRKLGKICDTNLFSEEGFQNFIKTSVAKNNNLVGIDKDSALL